MAQTLAIKYRPHRWEDVVEQNNIKTILQQQLQSGEWKHAYLFCGGAGTGKTTCARIFANEINKGEGNPIELDAASNNGVDDVREIIQQAKTKSLDSEYKCFILDECFHGDTLISTLNGSIPIRDVKIGDVVRNMTGIDTVTHVFKNRVFTDRLCCVIINGVKTYTTVDHLYFTQDGWIEAKDLQRGDIVYAPTYMRGLWERVFEQTEGSEVLLQYLCAQSTGRGKTPEEFTKSGYKILRDLWQTILCDPIKKENDVFTRLQSKIYKYSREDHFLEYRSWETFKGEILQENVGEQSYEQSRNIAEDDRNSQIKWYLECLERTKGWERAVHDASIDSMGGIESNTYIRVSNPNENGKGLGVSHLLQSRPRLSREKVSDRGGWEGSSIEVFYGEGREEKQISNVHRVDGVEVYKRGYNDELFRCGFADSELSREYVDMYDLEVEGHHSYFANGTLVHNCHMMSNSAWNAMLKLIEEPPAKSIFIFATTDPQKIPKTILSRVQRYDFQRISQEGILYRLNQICGNENIQANEDALEYIAKIAEGGMRDAITLMDKCISYSENISLPNVVAALGTVDYDTMIELTTFLMQQMKGEAVKIVEEIHNSGKDIKQFVNQYLKFLIDVRKYQIGCDWKYISIPRLGDYEEWLEAEVNGPEEENFIEALLEQVVRLNSEIKYSATPKYDFEAMILY